MAPRPIGVALRLAACKRPMYAAWFRVEPVPREAAKSG